MKLRVTTESGSVYELDQDAKLMRRTRGAEGNELDYDGKEHPYLAVLAPVTTGGILAFAWIDKGRKRVRTSTRIVSVEEVDVPASPDQPTGNREGTAP